MHFGLRVQLGFTTQREWIERERIGDQYIYLLKKTINMDEFELICYNY